MKVESELVRDLQENKDLFNEAFENARKEFQGEVEAGETDNNGDFDGERACRKFYMQMLSALKYLNQVDIDIL